MALDVLERYRKDFAPGLFSHVEKWSAVADDLEVAEALGTRVAAPALALEPGKVNVLRKWARLRSVGKRRLAVLAAVGLEAMAGGCGRRPRARGAPPSRGPSRDGLGRRRAPQGDDEGGREGRAGLPVPPLRGREPGHLRSGSENLDAARRAALIAKLEAQAALVAAS